MVTVSDGMVMSVVGAGVNRYPFASFEYSDFGIFLFLFYSCSRIKNKILYRMNTATVVVDIHARWFYLPLVLSVAFICGYGSLSPCYQSIDKFVQGLDDKQKKLYEEVTSERYCIFRNAVTTAIFFAFLYALFSILMGCRNWYHFSSNTLLIIMASMYLIYKIAPKKKSMLIDGELSAKDSKDWMKVYECMDSSFWTSFVYGLIGSAVLLLIFDIASPHRRMAVSIPLSVPSKTSKYSKSKTSSKVNTKSSKSKSK
jgi:hypothetical protein